MQKKKKLQSNLPKGYASTQEFSVTNLGGLIFRQSRLVVCATCLISFQDSGERCTVS